MTTDQYTEIDAEMSDLLTWLKGLQVVYISLAMLKVATIVVGLAVTLSFGCSRSREKREPSSSTALRVATCLGPADAKSFAVYLHGMDASSVSDQELGNRTNLARIADALSIRIALPRATSPCPDQQSSVCWGWAFDDREIEVAATTIKSAAKACFDDRPFGLIGFSNGGYLLSKIFRTCRLREEFPNASWVVTVGSAVLKGNLEPQPASLKGCGRMVIVAGTGDTYNFDPTNRLLESLKEKGADVKARSFDGGHVVPDRPLRSVLQELVAR